MSAWRGPGSARPQWDATTARRRRCRPSIHRDGAWLGHVDPVDLELEEAAEVLEEGLLAGDVDEPGFVRVVVLEDFGVFAGDFAEGIGDFLAGAGVDEVVPALVELEDASRGRIGVQRGEVGRRGIDPEGVVGLNAGPIIDDAGSGADEAIVGAGDAGEERLAGVPTVGGGPGRRQRAEGG